MTDENTESSECDELREEIHQFLRSNIPQIQMHGGTADIVNLDPEEGSVHLVLGGVCSGCGLSPMTMQAVKRRLPEHIEEIDTVYTDTGQSSGLGGSSPFVNAGEDDESGSDAPF